MSGNSLWDKAPGGGLHHKALMRQNRAMVPREREPTRFEIGD